MYLFFLGVIFGFGLHAAIRSVAKTVQLRRLHKEVALEEEIQRRVNVVFTNRDPWNDHESYMVKGTTSGPGPFRPIRHP